MAAKRQEMAVILNRKTFESPLINMALSARVLMGMQSHRVSQSNPAQKVAHSAILAWFEYQMPMIGQQLVSQDLTGIALQSLVQDAFKGVVVLGLMKDRCTGISTIQSTVNAARLIYSFVSTHAPIPKPSWPKKKSLAKKRVLTRMALA